MESKKSKEQKRIMTNDEKLEKKYWSKEAQELDDFYSKKYFNQSTCIIPFHSFLWIAVDFYECNCTIFRLLS